MSILIPVLEVFTIAFVFYYLLSFFWNTRAMDLLFGLFVFLVVFVIATTLKFPVLETLMLHLVNVAVVALLIIFQPELRLALSRINVKGKKYREGSDFDHFLDALSQSVYRLSEKRVGALILLENQDSLDEFANRSVLLHARFSSELLESIFSTNTPLHDGAVIIRGTNLISAATILPLADESSQLSKSMGTRHRAGLGISLLTDVLVIVVSEETGKVSVARDGIMTRGVKMDRFKGIVRSIFASPQMEKQPKSKWYKWFKTWKIQ